MTLADIIQQAKQLNRDEQRELIKQLVDITVAPEKPDFDVDAWLESIRSRRFQPPIGSPSVADLVNEVREERDAELLRRLRFGDSAHLR